MSFPVAEAAIVLRLAPPYGSGVPAVSIRQQYATGCGANLSITKAPSFNISTGRAQEIANASIHSCKQTAASAGLIASMGVSNVSLTPPTSGVYTVTAKWRVTGWLNLSIRSVNGSNLHYRAASGGVEVLFSLYDSKGNTVATSSDQLFVKVIRGGHIYRHFAGNVTAVVVQGVSLKANQSYFVDASIIVDVRVLTSNLVSSGISEYASVKMAKGSLLAVVSLSK